MKINNRFFKKNKKIYLSDILKKLGKKNVSKNTYIENINDLNSAKKNDRFQNSDKNKRDYSLNESDKNNRNFSSPKKRKVNFLFITFIEIVNFLIFR